MQEIRSSNRPVDTGISDPNKFQARHYRSLRLGPKLKYLKFFFKNHAENEVRRIVPDFFLYL